jgi:hypothetical protein
MKGLTGLLPWAIVLVLAGAALWFLYDRHLAAGRWVFALLLVGHGAVHLLYLAPTPAATAGGPSWPFDLAGGPFGGALGLDAGQARVVAIALIAAVVVVFSMAGLSALGLLAPEGWWPALTVAGSVLSLLLLVVWFDPQLSAGIVLDVALIWLAGLTTWRPHLV